MMENRPFNRPKRNLEAELETVRLIFQQDRGALLLAAAAILFGLFQSRAVVVSRIGALQAVYDSLLILLFLAFAAALLLLRYVRTHDSLSVGLDRLKAFVEFDGRFGVVLGAASILLGLKTWEELLHLSLFGLDAQALNPQGIGPLWYLSLLFPDLEVLFWGGLSVLAGWKCRTGYTGGNRLALAGIFLAIAAVGVSFTPVGDVLPLLIYTAGL